MFPQRFQDISSFTWQDDTLITSSASGLQFVPDFRTSQDPAFTLPLRSSVVSLEVSGFAEGMLVGGTTTGAVQFWKPAAARDPARALLKEEKLFDTPVRVMEFNGFKSNLLAVGGSEVLILNLDEAFSKRSQAEFTFRPGGESDESNLGEISSLSWNPKISYILAAASANGMAQLWDLRTNSTIFSIYDPNYMDKCTSTSLVWNLENPVQFIMGYNYDKSPVLQVWDLRYANTPIQEFRHAHEAGITAAAWCPHDTGLLVSFDVHGKGVLWNFIKSEPILTTTHDLSAPIVSARWVPNQYGSYSVLTSDGTLEIRSIYDIGVSHADEVVTEDSREPRGVQPKQGYSVSHVPNWLYPKTCLSLSFGNVMVCCRDGDKSLSLVKVPTPETTLGQLVKTAAQQAVDKQWASLAGSIANLTAQNPADKLELDLILTKTQEDGVDSALALLGLDKKTLMVETEQYTGKKRETTERRKVVPQESKPTDFIFASCSTSAAEDFFNKARVGPAKDPTPKQAATAPKAKPDFKQTLTETISKNTNWKEGGEKLLKENLITRNLQCAIDCALIAGRTVTST